MNTKTKYKKYKVTCNKSYEGWCVINIFTLDGELWATERFESWDFNKWMYAGDGECLFIRLCNENDYNWKSMLKRVRNTGRVYLDPHHYVDCHIDCEDI